MTHLQETALRAAQGQDTQDFLDHIAWTDVILPKLLKEKEYLTGALVGAVLSSPQEGTDSKEQIAGKIQGIDSVIKLITKLVREGQQARDLLKQHNISLS